VPLAGSGHASALTFARLEGCSLAGDRRSPRYSERKLLTVLADDWCRRYGSLH